MQQDTRGCRVKGNTCELQDTSETLQVRVTEAIKASDLIEVINGEVLHFSQDAKATQDLQVGLHWYRDRLDIIGLRPSHMEPIELMV